MTERAIDEDAQATGVAPEGFSWSLAARALLALVGCYVMAAVVSMAIARGFTAIGLTVRSEGAAAGTLIGLLMWPCAIVWVFAARSVSRIAIIMASVTATAALIAWAAGQPL